MNLVLRNITKSYGPLLVLDHINMTFEQNVCHCLMSPSGSGKTTLLRILMRLEQPDQGVIETDGPIPFQQLKISAVFQENRLCESFSPIENIMISMKEHQNFSHICQEAKRLLPAECLTRPVSTLSGGMKRRVAILRALLSPSDLLLMDEPFTGLDEEIKQNVIRYIEEKREHRFLILTTHQGEDVELLGGKKAHLF